MNTTNLFVELIIVGVGFLACLAGLAIIFLGFEWIPWSALDSPISLLLIVGLAYVIGIVADRSADSIFSRLDKNLRKKEFQSNKEYHEARTFVYVKANDKISSLFEYGRSRIRILRSWILILSILGLILPIIILKTLDAQSNSIKGFAFALFLFLQLLSSLMFYAWRSLSMNDYERLKETFFVLRKNEE
jgi:hypothetical protein